MNQSLKNAELVREQIEQYLPPTDFIDSDKLNENLDYMCGTGQDINPDLPLSMRMVFGIYTMANFASQFHYKINLDGTKLPTNVIGFLLSKSGSGKDSTINIQRKALDPGYAIVDREREESAKHKAREAAEAKNGEPSAWQQEYKQPLPLDNTISTVEGMVARLNIFQTNGLGIPSVVSTEIGSELGTNPNIVENIRLISELFDVGDYKSKAIKDTERQDKPVNGMGMNSMFAGSEDNIILDRAVSAKFKQEFITKLARRCYFVYPTQKEYDAAAVNYTSYEDMKSKRNSFEMSSKEARSIIGSTAMDMAERLLDNESRIIEIDDDALEVYKDYKMYTNSLGNGIDYIHKSVGLEQMHRSWKMLKLAGVFCLWDSRTDINLQDIEEAIYATEVLGGYLGVYEEFASKEPYELLVDYFHIHPDRALTLHDLKKRDFIPGSTGIESKVKELVKLADSLAGSDGIVKFSGDTVTFKPFEKVGNHMASYVQVSGEKEERAAKCHSGFVSKETTFEKLSGIMINDTAYSPFKFQDGKRKNDNIISGATWIALDVDDSDITIEEMHDIMQDYNHHVATTSNPDNPYKFRIIIELDNIVDLPVREWKQFVSTIGKEVGITIDPVSCTKSQIMFGYKGSKLFSTLDSEPFPASESVKKAIATADESFARKQGMTITQKAKALDNPLETFKFAFNDEVEARSLTLFKLWKFAKDLGAKEDECEKLMNDLNYSFWSNPISDERFDNYVKQMRQSF